MSATEQSSDGYAEISVSPDGMRVLCTLVPPRGAGNPITIDYMESILEGHGVINGIHWEEVRQRVLEVNSDRRTLHGIVLAEGEPPIDEVPAHLKVSKEILRKLGVDLSQPPKEGSTVQGNAPIVIVRRKQELARVVGKRKGQEGTDVFGNPVAPGKRQVRQIRPGKNTRIAEGRLIATRSGRVQLRDGTIWVDKTLEITGSVDYGTGDIEFPGDVVLKGEVKDGFHVWAAGSINAAGTVDVSQIYCKKSFVTPGGIIGRQDPILRAGGQVSCRFVEHCQVESRASLFIKEYAYQSRLLVLDRIVLGDEGQIIGGQAVSAHGVIGGELGNEAEVATEVVVGINFIAHRRIESCRDAYHRIREELGRLEELEQKPAVVRRTVQLTELRQKYAVRMENLLEQIDRNEEAEVVARKAVYPGVIIRICRAELFVTSAMGPTRFYLDKSAGRIVHEPFDPASIS